MTLFSGAWGGEIAAQLIKGYLNFRPWAQTPALHDLGVMMYAHNLRTQKVEAGGSIVEGYP